MQDNVQDLQITVPIAIKTQNIVQYLISFIISQQHFEIKQRYSELKQFHQTLETLRITLPSFPATHWWKSVNSDPNLIEERRQQLDQYFKNLISCKMARESLIFKNFILSAQKESEKKIEKQLKQTNTQRKKRPLKTQLFTPNLPNVYQTPLEVKERSQSLEHKPTNPSTPKIKPSPKLLNYGGSKMFRGILAAK